MKTNAGAERGGYVGGPDPTTGFVLKVHLIIRQYKLTIAIITKSNI